MLHYYPCFLFVLLDLHHRIGAIFCGNRSVANLGFFNFASNFELARVSMLVRISGKTLTEAGIMEAYNLV